MKLKRVFVLFAALSLVLSVLPVGAVAAEESDGTGDVSVEYDFSGFTGAEEGISLTGQVVAQVTDTGDLGADEPVRFVGTLEHEGTPVADREVAYQINGEFETTTTDDQGRFFFPPEGHAPLTLANSDLADGGERSDLRFTPPAAGEYELSVQLAQTGEGEGAVDRIFGDGRIDTAVEVSQATFDPGVPTAFVATGHDFPDALTGGPVADLLGGPILLTLTEEVPPATAAELERLDAGRIVVFGGTEVVGDAVLDELAGYTDGSVDRMSGPSRFDTAAAIALENYDAGVEAAYVATGGEFADALSGGVAAAMNGGPVLLTLTDDLPSVTADALADLAPEQIYVLGGTAAVSDEVASELENYADVERVSGPTRFATSAQVSQHAFPDGDVNTVYVATGAEYADALTGTPAAAVDAGPMLLVTRDEIPAEVTDELQRLHDQVSTLR